MHIRFDPEKTIGKRDAMIYGHFIEHFHRQIYGGVYDPDSKFADEDGFRTDVLEALRKIQIPVLRWPGGCFVSSYHWKDAVGPDRKPFFDKAWRVEDPNSFGTDEFIRLCRKIGCAPYICTNAGTGTAEEMSDWVEYCNLEQEGMYARQRIENGFSEPHRVPYWSIGNENYGVWEIGQKTSEEWSHLVRESAKMIRHVDPSVELSAAALSDVDWNMRLLERCGDFLDWISVHEYWDRLQQENNRATYEQCMAFTDHIDHSVDEVRGLLKALKLYGQIRIAFDEWNLRGWHHPNVHTIRQGRTKEEYLDPRDKNDDNSQYTMADAVFTACFLSAMNRNCDIVGMANFAPVVNTRGCIFTHPDGLVLRSTYHVFDLYVNYLGDVVLDAWSPDPYRMNVTHKNGQPMTVDTVDVLVTCWADRPGMAIALVNKHPDAEQTVTLSMAPDGGEMTLHGIRGSSTESYNDIGQNEIEIHHEKLGVSHPGVELVLPPHSVHVLEIQ